MPKIRCNGSETLTKQIRKTKAKYKPSLGFCVWCQTWQPIYHTTRQQAWIKFHLVDFEEIECLTYEAIKRKL